MLQSEKMSFQLMMEDVSSFCSPDVSEAHSIIAEPGQQNLSMLCGSLHMSTVV